MRPRYSRILVVTLCLLALATSASAETAWVLWANGKDRIAAFETLGTCMDEAKRNIVKFPESSDSSWSVLALRLAGGSSVFRYECVPDSVDDPRGLKTK